MLAFISFAPAFICASSQFCGWISMQLKAQLKSLAKSKPKIPHPQPTSSRLWLALKEQFFLAKSHKNKESLL